MHCINALFAFTPLCPQFLCGCINMESSAADGTTESTLASSSENTPECPCAICLNPLDDASIKHTLVCNHAFHVECIIDWFRLGHNTCPVCRDNTLNNTLQEQLGFLTLRERYKMLRRQARSKHAAAGLKKLVNRLKKAEDRERVAKRNLADFKKEHKEHFKSYRSFRTKRWKATANVHKLKRQIGVYVDPKTPAPRIRAESSWRGDVI